MAADDKDNLKSGDQKPDHLKQAEAGSSNDQASNSAIDPMRLTSAGEGDTQAWDQMEAIIDTRNTEHLQAFLHLLPPSDIAYTISHLDNKHRQLLFSLIPAEHAADLLDHFEVEHAADLIEELTAQKAAAIVEELDSDHQADILLEMDEEDAEQIIEQLPPEEAEDVRRLVEYDPETAGGIMRTEFMVGRPDQKLDEVVEELRRHVEEDDEFDPSYVYVADMDYKLVGLVRLRQLVLRSGSTLLREVMEKQPISVHVHDDLLAVENKFDTHSMKAAPVVDQDGELVGVVSRASLQEQIGEQVEEDFLRFGGIVKGEETRSMPLWERAVRRLVFLGPNLLLLMISVSIIALYEDVIEKMTALAVFLPVVIGLSGSAGNQSLAVSMREMAIGLARPGDVLRIALKEIGVGILTGIVLGISLGVIAYVTRGDTQLGFILGAAFIGTSIVATCLGGVVPLVLKSLKMDPAMAAGPIVTTVVDATGSFFVLFLAHMYFM